MINKNFIHILGMYLLIFSYISCSGNTDDSGGGSSTTQVNHKAVAALGNYIKELEKIENSMPDKNAQSHNLLEEVRKGVLFLKQGLNSGKPQPSKDEAKVIFNSFDIGISTAKELSNISQGQIDKLNKAKNEFIESL